MGDTLQTILDPADYSGYRSGAAATESQRELEMMGIEEQRRQFDINQQNLAPFLAAAQEALGGQMRLSGMEGGQAQQYEIDLLKESPMYQESVRVGEEGVLRGASATGGLRGGNVQRALATTNQSALASQIARQQALYGGIAGTGPGVGGQIGAYGAQAAGNIQSAYSRMGYQGIEAANQQTQGKQSAATTALGIAGFFCDERLKDNVYNLTPEECHAALMSLDLKRFNYIGDERQSIGPLAQQCPDFLVREIDGVKIIDKQSLIFCMIGAMQYDNELRRG